MVLALLYTRKKKEIDKCRKKEIENNIGNNIKKECVCVCVCVCMREREPHKKVRKRDTKIKYMEKDRQIFKYIRRRDVKIYIDRKKVREIKRWFPFLIKLEHCL